jgi:hypothetical protein
LIALDDYVGNDSREPLAEMADILKVDLKLTTLDQRAALVKKHGPLALPHAGGKRETRGVVALRDQRPIYQIYQLMLAQESGEWRLRAASAIASRLTATSWPLRTGRPNSGSGSLQGRVNSRVCLVIRLQLSTSTIPACSLYATRATPFEAGDPKPLETTGDVLLCKTRPLCPLRACTRTSTINLFLLASFPRRPSASQAVPGGATDPTTDNRYADIFIFSPIRVCFSRCG